MNKWESGGKESSCRLLCAGVFLLYSLTLTMNIGHSSETSANLYRTTRRYIAEDNSFLSLRCENFKPNTSYTLFPLKKTCHLVHRGFHVHVPWPKTWFYMFQEFIFDIIVLTVRLWSIKLKSAIFTWRLLIFFPWKINVSPFQQTNSET
jgi:hypothetical protein